jgi:hypothetical protein
LRPDGSASEFKVRVPESERRGLFRMLSFPAEPAAPPATVPADVLTFSRTRIDLARAWNSLEAMVIDFSPQIGGMARMMIDAIGKDKDPTFDFRRKFVANLGDDVVSWQMPPKDGAAATVSGPPPQTALISSPNPNELAASLRLLTGMVPPDVAKLEEFTAGGVKAWSMDIPMGMPVEGQLPPPSQTIAFASARGYLAVTSDREALTGYLEGASTGDSSLIELPGLRNAAEKVGGFDTGLFGFANDRETMRSLWRGLTNPEEAGGNPSALALQQLLAASAMRGDGEGLGAWLDFSLLPPFEQVAKYFHFSVYAGAVNKESFQFKYFAPNPPDM